MTEEIQDNIEITSVPAVIEFNFDDLRGLLESKLERYDFVVTDDTLAEAKKDATEINKLAQQLDRRRKDAVAEVSKPIREFDENMKSLVALCKDVRKKITDQVEQFNEQTRETVRQLLEDERRNFWFELGVEERHFSAEFDDLVQASSLTAAGNLTKKARDTLHERVQADLTRQQRAHTRTLELENRCHRAGLTEPLTADNVRHVIDTAVDAAYHAEVDRLIDAELEREARMRRGIEERERRRSEAEARAGKSEAPDEPEKPPQKDVAPHNPPTAPTRSGVARWHATAVFAIECNSRITREQIEAELSRAMEKAGFKHLVSVQADRLD